MSSKLKGRTKAAILLIALGAEASANVLRKLKETEIEQLTTEIYSTEQVAEDVRKEVLVDCYEMALASGFLSTGGSTYANEMLTRALGEGKASEIMHRLVSSIRPNHFDFLKDTDPEQLATFIQEEQPQAIALILSHMPPSTGAKTLSSLPESIRSEVTMRIATMERTPPEVLEGVEAVLRRRLSSIITHDYTSAGGVDHVAAVLTNVDRATEKTIFEYLDENNPELAIEIRKLMFVFDNISQLDDPSMQRLLREVDAKDLAMALRGTNEELQQQMLRNLSSRASEMLREDMAVSGPIRMRQVEEAQQRIVAIVRRLEESGDLVIARGDDDVLI